MSRRRSPLVALALGAAVGFTGGGTDPATAAGTAAGTTPATVTVASVAATAPAAPLVVPEPLVARAPALVAISPGVPVARWQLADSSAGPVAGEVEGDPEAVAVAPSLEVTEALQRLRHDAAEVSATGRRPAPAALVAMSAALDQVGDPYVWGATGPDAFDCSGLTSWSYARAGVVIPRVSRDQYGFGGVPVDVADLLPGDLVFFATADWDPGVVHHVGMYVGNGLMVAAPRPGLTVRVEPVPATDYVGAVRPVPARGPAPPDAVRDDEDVDRTGPGGRPAAPTSRPTSSGPAASGTPTPGTPPAVAATPRPVPSPSASPTPTVAATATPVPSSAPTTVVVAPTAVPTVLEPVVTATLQPVPSPTLTPVPTPTLVPLVPLSPIGPLQVAP